MKKETLEYISGLRNAVKDEFIIGRERAGNSELIFVSLPESERPLYALWNSKKTAKKYKVKKNDTDEKLDEIKFEKVEPKGTGGKEVYIMLMEYALSELNKKNISINAAGAIVKLIDCIEWGTGKLCRKRDSKILNRNMIKEILKVSDNSLRKILKELKILNVLCYDNKKKAYFFNTKYLRKGCYKNED